MVCRLRAAARPAEPGAGGHASPPIEPITRRDWCACLVASGETGEGVIAELRVGEVQAVEEIAPSEGQLVAAESVLPGQEVLEVVPNELRDGEIEDHTVHPVRSIVELICPVPCMLQSYNVETGQRCTRKALVCSPCGHRGQARHSARGARRQGADEFLGFREHLKPRASPETFLPLTAGLTPVGVAVRSSAAHGMFEQLFLVEPVGRRASHRRSVSGVR